MMLFIGIVLAVLSTSYAQQLNICDGVHTNTFIRDVGDCRSFYLCSPNGPVHGSCDNTRLFNEEAQLCDYPYNVQCFTCPLTQPVVNLPIEGSCTRFIRCINSVARQDVCHNGLHFNSETQQCDVQENVNCQIEFTCPPNIPPGQIYAFRSETNCSVFFECTGAPAPRKQHCNPVLHFDEVTQQCTFPHLTDCPLPPPGDEPEDPEDPEDPDDPVTPPFSCPSDGHHPHPTSCSAFYICAGGEAFPFDCGELHFNENTNNCDFPENAHIYFTVFVFIVIS